MVATSTSPENAIRGPQKSPLGRCWKGPGYSGHPIKDLGMEADPRNSGKATGCAAALRTKSQVEIIWIFSRNIYNCSVCHGLVEVVKNPHVLFHETILHTFQDSELAIFKPFVRCLKVSFEMPVLQAFGG